MDRSYRQAMLSTQEAPLVFASEFVTTPLSVVIFSALLFTIISQTQWWRRWRRRT